MRILRNKRESGALGTDRAADVLGAGLNSAYVSSGQLGDSLAEKSSKVGFMSQSCLACGVAEAEKRGVVMSEAGEGPCA